MEVKSMGRDDVLALLAAHRGEIERFRVESLRLFGSVARGEAAADSDVDLLVSFRASPTFSAYMKLRIFLEDLLGVQVDLITESGLREGVRPFVEKDAIRVA
jgi:predicted nucleotidyltransferase